MSDSLRPQRRQPTRLPCPWDSPGKNTWVGCHFLLQCMKVKSESEVAQSCPTLATPWTAAYQAPLAMGFSRQEYWSRVPLPSPSTEWSRAKANRVLPRELTRHSKHPLPTTQEKTLHMGITRCSTPKSDWFLCSQRWRSSIQSAKNKTGSWVWLRSWTPYCQIEK